MSKPDVSGRGIFDRPAHSFEFDQRAFQWISEDEANPLNRISQIIPDGASVLDVGAGNGVLAGRLIHKGRDCVLDGVDRTRLHNRQLAPNTTTCFVER